MGSKAGKRQRSFLILLVACCIGLIVAGGVRYFQMLRKSLQDSTILDVMNVTQQQQQAFDAFINGDRERLHSYAEFFANNPQDSPEDVRTLLSMFQGGDAACMVLCADEGWACSSTYDGVLQMQEEDWQAYRSLTGSGVRNRFVGMFSGQSKFSYYETFTYPNGHQGLIEKAYNRSALLESFSLSLYRGQGYGYIMDKEGDILLRSVAMTSKRVYDNVFTALAETHNPQEDIDAFGAALEANETGSIVFRGDGGSFVYTYVPLDSVDGWFLLSIVPVDAIRDEGDTILRNTRSALWFFVLILLIATVLTLLIRRTQKEIDVRDQEIKYQSQLFKIFTTYLSRNTDDVYMMYDHETEVLEYVSPNVERVLGVSEDELTGYLHAADLAADPERTAAHYAEVKALTPGMAANPWNTERVNAKTGEHKFFLENAYCTDLLGRSKRVAYFSDRTREQRAQDSLLEALRMAQAANDAKSAFLSSVSHDIRTPMNAVIGFLALMRDEADNPGMVREYTQRIEAASQHLLGLINDVLDMNKIESGSTTLNVTEMDLAEVIDEINTIIRPQAKAKGQAFEIYVSHLEFEHLMGDKMRINQILINLLSNAVKYTQEDGLIEMRVEELSQVVNNYSRVRFTIRDNGMGMSPEYLEVIFDPFTREDTAAIHEIQGTGLGMAITKSLVDLMGGSIQVESERGKGSTFTVELELRIQETSVREDDPKFWEDHKLARIIVTDDDEQVCLNIVKTMAKTGVVTDYATDGSTAVQMIGAARESGQPYDLILLDWQMPTLNGLETARLIRKNYSEKIPILLLTAYDWSDIEQEAMEIGVNHFMPKPFFMSTFKDAIRRVMGHSEQKKSGTDSVVHGKHILVVDDIEVNRIILIKILGSLGAECDTAVNGQEAFDKFEAAQTGQYDLILMDVQMPVMNGYEATRAIRASSHPMAKAIPIIAMTANAFVDDVRDAIESGMDAHIAKPVQIDNLKVTIQQVLESRAAQDAGEGNR